MYQQREIKADDSAKYMKFASSHLFSFFVVYWYWPLSHHLNGFAWGTKVLIKILCIVDTCMILLSHGNCSFTGHTWMNGLNRTINKTLFGSKLFCSNQPNLVVSKTHQLVDITLFACRGLLIRRGQKKLYLSHQF